MERLLIFLLPFRSLQMLMKINLQNIYIEICKFINKGLEKLGEELD
jgi:hypothetical protein